MVAYEVEHQEPTYLGDLASKWHHSSLDEAMVDYAIAIRRERGRVILWKFRRVIRIPWPIVLLMLPVCIPFEGPPTEIRFRKVALLDYDFEPAKREATRLREEAEWRSTLEANRV